MQAGLNQRKHLGTAGTGLLSLILGTMTVGLLTWSPVAHAASTDTETKKYVAAGGGDDAKPTIPNTSETTTTKTVPLSEGMSEGGPSKLLISAPALISELNEALNIGMKKDLDKGISMLTEVIKKAPAMALAYNDRGMLYYRANKLKPAEDDLNKALELDSSDSEYWSNRGLIRMMKGGEGDAMSDLDKAISISKKNLLALATRGAIFMRRGQFEKAKADFDVALEADPKSALNLNNRAMARFQTGDQKGAIADIQSALEVEPNSEVMKKNLELFKSMSPGELSVRAESEFAVKESHLRKDPTEAQSPAPLSAPKAP